ncbi:OLC1v1019783C1 [Oldenlandia corymbosa var. corymbosa]|uniref:OLC1v1019783C1 n=1 Tax=Oldenlandia corymbosa var. corymbosa TaxID=529605 RepID=A0AAV1EF94_OLDCO|nr:OLC1v1019783C1 [Oldenlandia corymbosa var. corymbosa]
MMRVEPPATEHSVMAVMGAARPSSRSAYDKLAFAVHATHFTSGFVLYITGPAAFPDTNPAKFSDNDKVLFSLDYDEIDIQHWNQGDDRYAFVYSKLLLSDSARIRTR